MIDIALLQKNGKFDIDFKDGDIAKTQSLIPAILMSIFCKARAELSQVNNQIDRRGGHFTNSFSQEGYEIGSLLWLYTEQNKIDESTIDDIEDTINKGLEWLVNDGYLQDIETEAVFVDNKLTINIITLDSLGNQDNYNYTI